MFFKKRKTEKNANMISLENVYLLKTLIISNIDDESGFGPQTMDMYFLARNVDGKYYELFSECELDKNENNNMHYFNKPYITKATPLKEFLASPAQETMERTILFDYITQVNVNYNFGKSPYNKEDIDADDF